MFTPQDQQQLASKGITEAQATAQLNLFRTGFPYLRLSAAAAIGQGIVKPGEDLRRVYLSQWASYLAEGKGKVVKFVPASGAASRMFKNLFEFLASGEQTDFVRRFFNEIHKFAFYQALDEACRCNAGKGVDALVAEGQLQTVVSQLLGPEGLGYGQLPKGLLLFHSYASGPRTPLEEHLVEGALYASGKDKQANIHFTVSPEHRPLFEALVEAKAQAYAAQFGVSYNISFSEQKPSTDTLAATPEGEPFRNDDGTLLFRPGGHGALIENLNDLDADIVFIKNIDNVVPDGFKQATVENKQLLAGILVTIQHKIFEYLELLDSGEYTHAQLEGIIRFMRDDLNIRNPQLKLLEDTDLVLYMKKKLNRPLRVCGMVPNVGEPGGGPFIAYNPDGTTSTQILESSQIDTSNADYVRMFKEGTHFNPVDLVCAIRDHKGQKFDLTQFIDQNTGFISQKSKNGRNLQALERPGLWNGSMSDWNTIFVEVPIETFNPVKTVNDLLRPQHQ